MDKNHLHRYQFFSQLTELEISSKTMKVGDILNDWVPSNLSHQVPSLSQFFLMLINPATYSPT